MVGQCEAWLMLKSIGNDTVKPDELARSVLRLAMEGERDPVRLHDGAARMRPDSRKKSRRRPIPRQTKAAGSGGDHSCVDQNVEPEKRSPGRFPPRLPAATRASCSIQRSKEGDGSTLLRLFRPKSQSSVVSVFQQSGGKRRGVTAGN